MKPARDLHPLLKRMAAIRRMERGTLCRLAGRPHYNLQTWQDGRNVSRYVRSDDVADLQESLDGYRRFMELVKQYADVVIRRTRAEQTKAATARKGGKPKVQIRPSKRHRQRPNEDV